MRDNKRLNQNIPISRQSACWAELQELTDNLREIRDNEQLPALRCVEESRPMRNNTNSRLSGLPPIPPKRNIKTLTYVPPQQREHLTPHMPHISSQRPHHNMMDRYREPHPPKVKHTGGNGEVRATKVHVRKTNAYIKATNVDMRKPSVVLDTVQPDVVITEGDKGFSYDIDPKLCLDEDRVEKFCRASVEAKTAAQSKVARATSVRPVTTIRSIIQCADAPLLPGRREPMVPHPPLDPYNLKRTGIESELRSDQEGASVKSSGEGTTLPAISKHNKNIFVCHPPNTPKSTGSTFRRKWRHTTANFN